MGSGRIVLDLTADFVTVHLGEHGVGQYKVRVNGVDLFNGDPAVLGNDQLVVIATEGIFNTFLCCGTVIRKEDLFRHEGLHIYQRCPTRGSPALSGVVHYSALALLAPSPGKVKKSHTPPELITISVQRT